jgi:hypothetical protein
MKVFLDRAKKISFLFILLLTIMGRASGEEALPLDSTILWIGTSQDLHDDVFLSSYGYTFPPFDDSNNSAYIIRTTTPQTVVRFYTPGHSGPLGSWATATSEVRNMTPDQVWDHLALPQSVAPSHVSMMMLPSRDISPGTDNTGAWMIGGYTGAFTYTDGTFSRHLNGGGYQYFLLGPNKPDGMVATVTGSVYGVPSVVVDSGNYTTSLILNQDGTSNQGREFSEDIPVFSYLYSAGRTNSSANIRNIAKALDKLNALPGAALYADLYQPLDILWIRGQNAELAAALEQINPEGYGAVVFSRLHSMADWLNAFQNRQNVFGSTEKDGVWRQWGSLDRHTVRLNSWKSAENRVIFGVDRMSSENWQIGGLIGYESSRTEWPFNGRADGKNLRLGFFTRHEPYEGLYVSLAGLAGIGRIESRRTITLLNEPLTAGVTPFGDLAFLPDSRVGQADFTAYDAAARVSLEYFAPLGHVHLTPRFLIDWMSSHAREFTETGAGALNLILNDLDGQALRFLADITCFFRPSYVSGKGLNPYLRAGVSRYRETGSSDFNARFFEGGEFTVERQAMNETTFTGGAGIFLKKGNWTISGQADGEWGDLESYGGRIDIQRRF